MFMFCSDLRLWGFHSGDHMLYMYFWLERVMEFISNKHSDYLTIILFIEAGWMEIFYSLELENKTCMIRTDWCLLRYVLWLYIWLILMNKPYLVTVKIPPCMLIWKSEANYHYCSSSDQNKCILTIITALHFWCYECTVFNSYIETFPH